jgi:alcohol dehydrogenase class IV
LKIDLNQTYHYSFPTNITFGVDSSNLVKNELKTFNLKNPLVVTDKGISKLVIFSNFLKENNLKEIVYCDLKSNPDEPNVLDGVKYFNDNKCDSIIAFGGGAALDVAKAIALKINHHKNLFEYDDALGGDKFITDNIPYIIAVPTTSGTGSEVGRSAVISDQNDIKRVLFSPYLLPKKVFLDPKLVMQLPAHITAAVGIDALTHNLEAYLVNSFNPMCDGIALEGIKLITESLIKSVNDPCLESKSKMMLAASMGAIAFQKGLGVVHSMAHSLSSVLGLHHGLANAIMLKTGIDFNSEVSKEKYKKIYSYCNLSESSDSLSSYISFLNSQIGIEEGLKKYNINNEQLEKLTLISVKDICHKTNPREVTKENFKKLFEKNL